MKEEKKYSKSERTRRFIIEKAAPVFNAKGFSGTSLSDLTEATKMTKGALYGNFRNKDEIAIEAFKYNTSIITRIFTMELAFAKSSIEKLHTFPKVFRKIYPRIEAIGGCPILNTITDSYYTHAALKELSVKTLRGMKKNIEDIINEGINNNEIINNVDPDMLSALFMSLIEGGFLMAKTMKNKKYFEESLTQIEYHINKIKI